MLVKIRPASVKVLTDYIRSQAKVRVSKFEQTVLDADTVNTLLTKAAFRNGREGWGIYYDGVLCGYAVVYRPTLTLDLLYVSNDYRNKGIATQALQLLRVRNMVVNRNNDVALALYLSLGMNVEFDDE